MRELIETEGLFDDAAEAFLVDPNAWALTCGWSRVRIYPGQHVAYVDYGEPQQRAHAAKARDLIDQLGLVGIRIKFTDEDGNYVSP